MSTICPCKDCKDRIVDAELGVNCHMTCNKYISWSNESRAKKEKISSFLNSDYEARSFKKTQVEKALKRRRS